MYTIYLDLIVIITIIFKNNNLNISRYAGMGDRLRLGRTDLVIVQVQVLLPVR